jgi:hypothetical protein
MPKEAVFTMKLEPALRAEFVAASSAAHRPASQVVRVLMREFIQRQDEARGEDEYLRRKAEAAAPAASMAQQQSLMNELHAMKEMIEDRFNTMAWLGQAKQNPIQSNLMLKMIRAGYSPALARAVLERMPEDLSAGDAVRWLMDVLERNLTTDENEAPLPDIRIKPGTHGESLAIPALLLPLLAKLLSRAKNPKMNPLNMVFPGVPIRNQRRNLFGVNQ